MWPVGSIREILSLTLYALLQWEHSGISTTDAKRSLVADTTTGNRQLDSISPTVNTLRAFTIGQHCVELRLFRPLAIA